MLIKLGCVKRLVLAAGVALICSALAGSAWAQVPGNGAVDGLTPQFVEVNGIRTRFYQLGHGAPLVLIHGGGCGGVTNSANAWSKNMRALARHFLVVAPDRPGHGMTEGTTAQCENSAFVDNWLYHFLQVRKLTQVNLAGQSAGGGVVFNFAVRHPKMVKTLILVSFGTQTPDAPVPNELGERLKKCPKVSNTLLNWTCRDNALSYSASAAFDPHSDFHAVENDMYVWRLKKGPSYNTHVTGVRLQYGKPPAEFIAFRNASWKLAKQGVLGDMPILMYYGAQEPLDWAAGAPYANLQGALAFMHLMAADPNLSLRVINHAGHFVNREKPSQFDHAVVSWVGYWENR